MKIEKFTSDPATVRIKSLRFRISAETLEKLESYAPLGTDKYAQCWPVCGSRLKINRPSEIEEGTEVIASFSVREFQGEKENRVIISTMFQSVQMQIPEVEDSQAWEEIRLFMNLPDYDGAEDE